MKIATLQQRHLMTGLMFLSYFWVIIFIGAVIVPLYTQTTENYFIGRTDFLRSYAVSEMIVGGRLQEIYNPTMFLQIVAKYTKVYPFDTGWLYPPVYLFIVQPLAYISLKISFIVWVCVQLGLFFAVSYKFLWRTWKEALILLSPTVFIALGWGQNSVLIAALYIAAFHYLNICPIISGIFFGCCIIKPQLAILVPFILLSGRHYRVFLAACATAIFFLLLSLLCYGIDPWLSYGRMLISGFLMHNGSLTPLASSSADLFVSHYLHSMPTVYNMANSLGLSLYLSSGVQLLVSLGCIWELVRIARDGSMKDPLIAMAYFSLLSPLCFFYFYLYDYVLVTAAISGVVMHSAKKARINVVTALLVLLVYFIAIIHRHLTQEFGLVLAPAITGLTYLYMLSNRDFESEINLNLA